MHINQELCLAAIDPVNRKCIVTLKQFEDSSMVFVKRHLNGAAAHGMLRIVNLVQELGRGMPQTQIHAILLM